MAELNPPPPNMKKDLDIINLIKNSEYSTKVQIFMARKIAGDGYDPYEKNFDYSNLNPITIKAYVSQVSPNALVYKQYGLHNMGAVEIICEAKYRSAFENCNKVVIDSIEYQVYKEGTGNRTLISTRPYNMIRVVLSRNG